MEIGKFYNLIIDLSSEKINSEINDKIDAFSSGILNKTAEIPNTELELFQLFENSLVNDLVPSDQEILKNINGERFFGSAGKDEIITILQSNPYDVQKIYNDLQHYKKERTEFLKKIDEIIKSFEFFDIPVFYPAESFHIGLLLPSDFTHNNKIKDVTRELNKWDKIIKNIKEIVGEDVEDTKIEYVSNGSLDFFFENSANVAMFLSKSFLNVVLIYEKIKKIREKRNELKDLGITLDEEKAIEKQEKEMLNTEFDKLGTELLKEFASKKIEKGRAHELSIAINGHIKYFAKYVDNGVIIEINSPLLSEPEQIKDEDSEQKKIEKEKRIKEYNSLKDNIDVVKKSMETINAAQKVGMDIMKMLNFNEEDDK